MLVLTVLNRCLKSLSGPSDRNGGVRRGGVSSEDEIDLGTFDTLLKTVDYDDHLLGRERVEIKG